MAMLNVFDTDAFSALSMTAAVDKIGYTPGLLGAMPNLFMDVSVRTVGVVIEERSRGPALIQTSARGAPPKVQAGEVRKAHNVNTVRLADSSRIMADELQNIRAFGQESELMGVQMEVARRQARILQDFDLTKENMRLGAVQGLVTDADGATISDWATILSQTIPTELDFDLDNASPASGAVRKQCTKVVRSMLVGLEGLGGNQVRVMALSGDAFWDDLTAHKEVRETFLNTQAAAALREGLAFESFNYGGITWVNYRGTDDGSTVAVGTDKAKFFPVGAGIFPVAYAPAERFEFVNTPGQPRT